MVLFQARTRRSPFWDRVECDRSVFCKFGNELARAPLAYSVCVCNLGIRRFWKTCGLKDGKDYGLGIFSPMAAGQPARAHQHGWYCHTTALLSADCLTIELLCLWQHVCQPFSGPVLRGGRLGGRCMGCFQCIVLRGGTIRTQRCRSDARNHSLHMHACQKKNIEVALTSLLPPSDSSFSSPHSQSSASPTAHSPNNTLGCHHLPSLRSASETSPTVSY